MHIKHLKFLAFSKHQWFFFTFYLENSFHLVHDSQQINLSFLSIFTCLGIPHSKTYILYHCWALWDGVNHALFWVLCLKKNHSYHKIYHLNHFFNYYYLFYFTILYWFCHTSTCIHHRCTRVPHPELPFHLPPHTILLCHPRAPSPSFLYPASNLEGGGGDDLGEWH